MPRKTPQKVKIENVKKVYEVVDTLFDIYEQPIRELKVIKKNGKWYLRTRGVDKELKWRWFHVSKDGSIQELTGGGIFRFISRKDAIKKLLSILGEWLRGYTKKLKEIKRYKGCLYCFDGRELTVRALEIHYETEHYFYCHDADDREYAIRKDDLEWDDGEMFCFWSLEEAKKFGASMVESFFESAKEIYKRYKKELEKIK